MRSRQALLVVEDDEELRKMYRSALAVAGFLVREAADGLSALTTLDREPVDLVVLDLGLPDISGLAIIQDIAAQAHTRHVPVLVVTGSTEKLDHLDVACVLRKPISPDALVTAVLKCLGSDVS
jgi:DNA-binding response OmpR family regulator